MPHNPTHVVGAAIIHNSRCLATQRGPTQSLPGKWEFPGGKVEHNESPSEALAREILEELNLQINVAELLGTGTAQVGNHHIILDVYATTLISGTIALNEHAAYRWLLPDELSTVDWADADIPVLEAVRHWMESLRRP